MASNELPPEGNKVDEFANMNGENKVDEFDQIGNHEAPPPPPAPEYREPAPPVYHTPPPKARREHRSIFWPIILITVGVLFLLGNLGITSDFNFGMLLPFWPVILILIGIDLLFSRVSTFLSGLLGLAVAGGMIWLFIYGPAADAESTVNWNLPFDLPISSQEVIEETFTAEMDDARDVLIELSTGIGDVNIMPTGDDDVLMNAELRHYGAVSFRDTGERNRQLELTTQPTIGNAWPSSNDDDLYWDVEINEDLPLHLVLDASIGSNTLDLSEMALERLEMNMSVGDAEVMLPAAAFTVDYESSVGSGTFYVPGGSDGEYSVNMSTGDLVFEIEDGANATILVEDASVGSITIVADKNLGIRLIVQDSGIGDVRVPDDLIKVSSGGDEGEGTWETEGYEDAEYQIEIVVNDISTGDVIIELT